MLAAGADGRRSPRRGSGDLDPGRPRRPLRDGGVARAVRVGSAGPAARRLTAPAGSRARRSGGVPVHVMTTDEVHGHGAAGTARSRRGPRGRLRRRPARLGQRQAARPVPLAVLQPTRPTSSAARSRAGRRCCRLIREAIAEHAGDDYPCTVKVPVGEGAAVRARTPTSDEAHATVPARRGVGLRRGHARRGVGVPRHDAQPRRGARRRSGRTPAWPTRLRKARPVAPDARRDQGRRRGGAAAQARSLPVWNRQWFTTAQAGCVVDPGARGRWHPHRRRGRREILDGGAGRHGRHRPTVLRRARSGPPVPRRRQPSRGRCQNSNLCVPAQMLGMKGVCYNPEVVKVRRTATTRRVAADGG